MRLVVDAAFVAERSRYRLRMHCEDCCLFDAERGCAHGYPTAPHRAEASRDEGSLLTFCKDFEAHGEDEGDDGV